MDPVTQQWLVWAAFAAGGWAVRHFWPSLFPASPTPPTVPAPPAPATQPAWLAALEAKVVALEQKILGK